MSPHVRYYGDLFHVSLIKIKPAIRETVATVRGECGLTMVAGAFVLIAFEMCGRVCQRQRASAPLSTSTYRIHATRKRLPPTFVLRQGELGNRLNSESFLPRRMEIRTTQKKKKNPRQMRLHLFAQSWAVIHPKA